MNEKPQVVRSMEGVGAAREAESRRIAEIAREIEELGPALEGRDRLARFDTAEKAKDGPAARGDEQKLLAQERARAQALERQLATREDEQKLLAQERARAQALERQLAARGDEQELLAQERARNQALELQLPVREDTRPDRERKTAASRSHGPASMATTSEGSDNLEAAHLMTQARLLLDQGNIISARSLLERAAESGSAVALFLLAETYDRAMLSAWGIFGRRGNVTKARKLYAKAVAGGVHEAKYRLSVLR